MNNLVFNNISSPLYTNITNTTLTISGEITNTTLTVTGDVEITNTTLTVTGDVEITNTTLTVTGDVEITNTTLTVTGDVEITNTTLTVTGDVEITNTTLTVTGDVEITNTTLTVTGDVEITNTTLTVTGDISVAGHTFTELNTTVNNTTGTGVVFDNTDISEITTGSYFIYNEGANAFTVSVQVSPTTDDNRYAFDLDNDDIAVPVDAALVIPISKFGQYSRLYFEATSAATFVAYYNGQM